MRRTTVAVARSPLFTLAGTVGIAILSVVLTLLCMEFRTSRADLINGAAEFHQRWMVYTEAFGDASDLVVVFESADPNAIKRAQETLGEQLRAEPELFSHVLYRVEAGHLRDKGLQYLSPAQLEAGLNRLTDLRPVIDGSLPLSLERMAEGLLFQLQSQASEDEALQQLAGLAVSLERFLQESRYVSPWPDVMEVPRELRGTGDQVTYLMNDSGTVGFLKTRSAVKSDGFDGAGASISRLRELIQSASVRDESVRIGLTGIPVLENDEMRRSKSDMVNASLVSFCGVGVLLFVGFRGLRHPVLALVMLAVAMCWTFGY
ncbi:MAG: MMPL family transporter, partial [Planctomycetaceae bacterium]